jgi:hypothetical protein
MTNLMTPRYLVIADYPNSHYEIGQIIELSVPKDAGGWDMVTLANNEEIMPKYPHLFRLLHWWEFRDEKEMRGYFKSGWRGELYYIKVDKWVKDGSLYYYKTDGMTFSCAYSTPITEPEYSNYINSKK